jgi:hypothetical protein
LLNGGQGDTELSGAGKSYNAASPLDDTKISDDGSLSDDTALSDDGSSSDNGRLSNEGSPTDDTALSEAVIELRLI